MNRKRILYTGFMLVLVLLLCSTGVFAQPDPPVDEEEEEDDGDVIIDLSGVEEAIEDLAETLNGFVENWDVTLKELLIAVLFRPFRTLAQQLLRAVTLLLTNTPSVHPNPAVQEIHRISLLTAYLLSGLVFAGAGLLYMTGGILWISYGQIRTILPRVVLALVFGSVSLHLLQYAVRLTNALTLAFMPSQLSMNLGQLAGLSTSLVLVWVINAFLLLVLVVIFILRGAFILFAASISPLIALGWAFPHSKRYADSFIGGWFAALAMAPLDVLALRFVLSMLEVDVFSPIQSVSNWVFGIAGFALLIWIPGQLYVTSQTVVGKASAFSGKVKKRVQKHRRAGEQGLSDEELKQELEWRRQEERSTDQEGNKFDYNWGDDD